MSLENPLAGEEQDQTDRPVKPVRRSRPKVRKRKRVTAGARGRLLFYGIPVIALVLIVTLFVIKIASAEQVGVPLMDPDELEGQGGLIDRDHPIPLLAEDEGTDGPEIIVIPEDEYLMAVGETGSPDDEDPDPSLASVETLTRLYVREKSIAIHAAAEETADVLTKALLNEWLIQLDTEEGWVFVRNAAGIEGYVKADGVSEEPVFVPVSGESYYVQNRQVYVREGPGTNHPIEGFGLRGMTLTVLEAGEGWSRIRTEHGLTGYMLNELFGPVKPANEITELECGRYMYIDTEEANLRESPSTDAEIIGAAFMDDRVYQISDNGGWSKIRTEGGVVSYVFNHLLREKPPANPFVKTNRSLYVNTGSVNVRSSPTTDASVIERIERDQKVTELEANDTWSKVKLESGKIGFIRSDLLTHVTPPPAGFERATGAVYVTTGAANIRSQPNTNCSIVTVVRHRDKLTKKAVGSEWTMIQTGSGQSGYISNDLISSKQPAPPATGGSSGGSSSGGSSSGGSNAGNSSGNADLRQRVVDIARSALGTPYRLSGKNMNAFDCSGLVKYTYEAIGYRNIPHGSDPQARQLGSRVSFSGRDFSNLLPGDLIFFSRGYGYHHVGIYIGNNQMIHAVSGRGVVVDNLLTYPVASRVNRVLN